MLLGAGRNAVADLGIGTIADALRPVVTDITVLDGIDGESTQRSDHHDPGGRRDA